MKVCILMGSPRKNGNTAAVVNSFCNELTASGHQHETIWLYDKKIEGCTACRCCQKDWSMVNCRIQDDFQEIADKILACDLIIVATPIYSWYCTAPAKALLDRLVYGMNKIYGDKKGPALWEGKHLALISTCGYPTEKGTELWEQGMRRYCKHSRLIYDGLLAERHLNYHTEFMDEDKDQRAKEFAQKLCTPESI